jgi:Flp pilus assembly protein TadD
LRIGFQIAADRYSYVSMLGGVVLLAAGYFWVLRVRPGVGPAAGMAIGLSVVALAGLIVLSRAQCRTWRSNEVLWTYALDHGGRHSPVIHNNLGGILNKLGRNEEARSHLEEAIRLKPDYPQAHGNLGFVLYQLGQLDRARAEVDTALQLSPDYEPARIALASILLRRGQVAEALRQFNWAQRLNPGNAEVYNNQAMIWASSSEASLRDGLRAVRAATRANELTGWKNPDFLDTCAAAYAEAGDFVRAVTCQTKAIDLASNESQKNDFRLRLKLYEAKQPYHEPAVTH